MVVEQSKQYGFERLDFEVAGCRGFVIQPAKLAKHGYRAWLWYAPTLSGKYPADFHEWMFSRLLDGGIAIAGLDVGESWGNARGREQYTQFYHHLINEFGFCHKACMLGQSRGGTMVYNWAAEHADSVACIGGIYPVCDLGRYAHRPEILAAYNMSDEELKAHLGDNNPIERLAALAAANVRILHIHGDCDEKVPLEEHSAELVNRYLRLGGRIELIVVNGGRHDLNEAFFQSQNMVDFFLVNGRP